MANNEVQTGYWIDHSKGPVLGATITLNSKWGASLVAAAAIIVQIVGGLLWIIVAFMLHQRFCTPNLHDESDAQRQVILRNTTGPLDGAWSLAALGRTWRRRKPKALRKAVLLASLPALIWIGFLAAGVFVGQIASSSYDNPIVLKKPGSCGFLSSRDNPYQDFDAAVAISQHQANLSYIAQQYSRSCYSEITSSAISCSVFPTQKLTYTIEGSQPCPLPDRACFNNTGNEAITLRSNPIDTHEHLGINAPKSDRLTFEHQWTCAPLQYEFVDNYTIHGISPDHNLPVRFFDFGRTSKGVPVFGYLDILGTNLTSSLLTYSVNVFQTLTPWDFAGNVWTPNGAFRQAQGDLSILFVSPNGLHYQDRVLDPMFRTRPEPDSGERYPFLAARLVYAMVCTTLFRVCNPAKARCTEWQGASKFLGFNDTEGSNLHEGIRTDLELNDQQNATLVRLVELTSSTSLLPIVNGLGNPLLATSYLGTTGGSSSLPDNQWILEVAGWFETSLAKIQYMATTFVSVGFDIAQPSKNNTLFLPADQESSALASQCSQQKVTAPVNYTNYNFFALIFIACFGIIIPIVAGTLKYLHHHAISIHPNSHKYLSYQADGYLELHRLLLESAGYGGWTHSPLEKPRTNEASMRIPRIQKVSSTDEEGAKTTLRFPHANDNNS